MVKSAALVVLLFTASFGAQAQGEKMSESVAKAISLHKEGKSVEPLFAEGFKVIGIGLMNGQQLDKHSTPTPAFLVTMEGKVEFKMGDTKTVLKPGDFFRIPAKKDHEILALEDARLLLIKL